MGLITYANKLPLYINGDIPDANKCNASDLNEIKTEVNANATCSTTETAVGQWIDNKTIYRKVITANDLTPDQDNHKTISHGISNLSEVISLKCIAYCVNGWFDFNNYTFYNNGSVGTTYILIDNTDIYIVYEGVGVIDFATKAYFIIEYTKTS